MPLFTYRSSRSATLVVGIGIAVLVETVAIHFLLRVAHPIAAWVMTALSLSAIAWVARDYRAMGQGAVRIIEGDLQLTVGRRYDVRVPRTTLSRVLRPTFRDLPAPGTNQGRDYLNMTKPATPNVLIELDEPVSVRLPGGVRRRVRRLGLHLDDAAGFLTALGAGETVVSVPAPNGRTQ